MDGTRGLLVGVGVDLSRRPGRGRHESACKGVSTEVIQMVKLKYKKNLNL